MESRARLPLLIGSLTAVPALICLAVMSANHAAGGVALWFLAAVVVPATAAIAFVTARWLARPLDRLAEREAEARRSRAQLDAILEHLPAAVYVKDLDGRYLLVNRRARELKGIAGRPLVGSTDRELFPPEVANEILAHDRTVLASRRPIAWDEVIPTVGGATTQLSMKFPLLDDSGAPYALGGISTDITERKWMERVQAAERRALAMTAAGAPLQDALRELLGGIEAIDEGLVASILLLDEDGVHLRNGASPGLPAEYVRAIDGAEIGPHAGSCGAAAHRREPVIVTDIARDPLWAPYRDFALAHGLRACWSRPIFDARGRVLGTFAIYYRVPRAPRPEHVGVVSTVERTAAVILERHRADAERARLVTDLGAANARFQLLFDGTADAILVIAADGRYVDANLRAAELTGHPREKLRQMRVGDLSPTPADARAGWPAIAAAGRWSGEGELLRADGSLLPVETRLVTAPLPTGTVYVSTMRDISERRTLERLRRDFIAVIGHELRNPLNSILGSAELMRRTSRLQPGAIDRILRQTKQMARLLQDLTDAHQVDSGLLELQRTEADLLPALRACIDEVADGAHRVLLDCPVGSLPGRWDVDRVCQVLRNLLSNALKYSREGTDVIVRVRAAAAGVEVAVIDQGPGIAKDALPRLFDRFYRAPESSGRVPGLGVGLYVCKQLIEAHGGDLTVRSERGSGSTFTFFLPGAAQAHAAAAAP